jgi:uncharacterized protein YjeT (DUF2065 family)
MRILFGTIGALLVAGGLGCVVWPQRALALQQRLEGYSDDDLAKKSVFSRGGHLLVIRSSGLIAVVVGAVFITGAIVGEP